MRAKSISDFRKNIAADIDAAVEDHVPLIITRPGDKRSAVVMALDDFESWKETMYLLSNPANVSELRKSIAQLENGEAQERTLSE